MPILDLQRRMIELGRVRLGDKGPKGEPRKLTTFRFTSSARPLLEQIAERYGGTVRPWEGAPSEGYFEVTTEASEIEIILPPAFSEIDGSPTSRYSQWYELWSGGGCQRRCDGKTEMLSEKPCLCNPDERACKITTRVSFMLPGSSVGVWRLDSHGYNAAVEAPTMLDFLRDASDARFIPALLRIEQRTKKVGGQTRRFIVPVIDFPQAKVPEIEQGGSVPLAINGPVAPAPRPALPAGETPLPEATTFETSDEKPDFGTPPPLPSPPKKPTKAERDKLVKIVAQLGEIDSGQDWSELVEKAAQSSYGHGIDDLTREEHAELLARLVKHAETLEPVPA